MAWVKFLPVLLAALPAVATALVASEEAAALDAAVAAEVKSVGAVEKVINMMTDMQAKAKQEKMDEQTAFAKFETWCKNKIPFMKEEIVKNGEEIETLTADIGKLKEEIKGLTDDLTKLNNDVAKYDKNMKTETGERETEHAAFLEEEKDYAESVDAVERALEVMQKTDKDVPGSSAAALAQLSSSKKIPAKAKSIVIAFMGLITGNKEASDASESEDDEAFESFGAPEANAYEAQSGGIIDLLKKLLDEFRAKLSECQKAEMNSKGAYDMIMLELTDAKENAERDIEEKSKSKSMKKEQVAENKKQVALTTTLKAENEKTLASMETECKEKGLSFQEKQNLRSQEIEAIGKAIEIMRSGDVAGNAQKHMSLVQAQKKGFALVQLRGRSAIAAKLFNVDRRLRKFLENESRRIHSKRLGQLAQKLATFSPLLQEKAEAAAAEGNVGGADPFAKVKAMIDSMITRLLQEQEADAEHEAFCDEEMGKNKVTRTKLTEDIDALTAACDEGKSMIKTLGDDIKSLSEEVVELEKAMGEATDLRTEEKAKNAATVKDAQAAQAAVEAATKVLKDFYQKAMTATALLQLRVVNANPGAFGLKTSIKMGTEEWDALASPDFDGTLQNSVDTGHKKGMQTFGDEYKGQQEESNGVIAMLEVILSDFASLQADTETSEASNQKAYEDYMIQSKKDKATSQKSIELKTNDKVAAEKKLVEDTADLKNNQDELIAADKYYKKLVPQCIDQGMTFEERQKARESEIDSLKQALEILSQSDVA